MPEEKAVPAQKKPRQPRKPVRKDGFQPIPTPPGSKEFPSPEAQLEFHETFTRMNAAQQDGARAMILALRSGACFQEGYRKMMRFAVAYFAERPAGKPVKFN